MSQPAIRDKTNLPNAPSASSIKTKSPEPSTTPTLSPDFAPTQGPQADSGHALGDVIDSATETLLHLDTDRAHGGPVNATAGRVLSMGLSWGPSEPFPPFDPNQGPYDDTDLCKFEIPIRSKTQDATIDARISNNPPGNQVCLDHLGLEEDETSPLDDDAMIAEANAVALDNDKGGFYEQEFGLYARAHGKGNTESMKVVRNGEPYTSPTRRLDPGGHGFGPSHRRPKRSASIPTLYLRPAPMEDTESSHDFDNLSMAPFGPTAQVIPRDENVPLSPGAAIESPPGESHTFNYTRSDDAFEFRAHTVGTGPNAPGLTSPLRPRFPERETEYVQSLVDERYIEDEGRERTSRGNAVAIHEARQAGVQQRDFAPVVERPRNSRVPPLSIPQTYDDPEETNMVDVGEAGRMRERQRLLLFAQFWEAEGFWRLADLIFNS